MVKTATVGGKEFYLIDILDHTMGFGCKFDSKITYYVDLNEKDDRHGKIVVETIPITQKELTNYKKIFGIT